MHLDGGWVRAQVYLGGGVCIKVYLNGVLLELWVHIWVYMYLGMCVSVCITG